MRLHSKDRKPEGRLSLQEAETQPNHQSGNQNFLSPEGTGAERIYLSNKQHLFFSPSILTSFVLHSSTSLWPLITAIRSAIQVAGQDPDSYMKNAAEFIHHITQDSLGDTNNMTW